MPSDVGMYRRVLRASIIARTVSKIRKVSVKKKTLTLRPSRARYRDFSFREKKNPSSRVVRGRRRRRGRRPGGFGARRSRSRRRARRRRRHRRLRLRRTSAPRDKCGSRGNVRVESPLRPRLRDARARARHNILRLVGIAARRSVPGRCVFGVVVHVERLPPPSDVWSRAPGPPNPSPFPFVSTPRSALMPFLAPAESALGLCVIVCARTAMVPLASATKPSRECTFCEPASRSAPKAGAATYDRLPISGAPPT